ncbi:TetR/AcrR family transcriptional regulator [Rhodococcus gannanensis]|uniref:TetR/AcrR family transcriptional regulator n=1 Tax=Rhodococcus gannanensis TaxID=1960308 RepID=A0ABW4NZ84_9NOCA
MTDTDKVSITGSSRPGATGRCTRVATDETLTAIREIALDLFVECGFRAARMSEIGNRMELRPVELYAHVTSKEQLLWDIIREYTTNALARVEAIAVADLDSDDKLERLIEAHADLVTTYRREAIVAARDADALTSAHAQELLELRSRLKRCWDFALI